MGDRQTRDARGTLRKVARRAGFVTAAVGVLLSMVVAGVLMRLALLDAADNHRHDLGSLLVSSCQAALALGDNELLQETLDELAPHLVDLSSAEAIDAHGNRQAVWRRADKSDSKGDPPESFAVTGPSGQRIGTVRVRVSTARAQAAVIRMWFLLGCIALVSLVVSWAVSAALGKEIDEKGRLEGELAAAERIQTSLLPRQASLVGAEIAARMLPADEVGGDYYDVIPCKGGAWVCVGDAEGHGLRAGLTMLMLQSGIGALLRHTPNVQPREVIQAINRVIYENGQGRLGELRYATLLAMHYQDDGLVRFSGGHVDPIVCRTKASICEFLSGDGPFVGLEQELEESAVPQRELRLEEGDLLVLYTDGVTEARSDSGEMFGAERLSRGIEASRHLPLDELIDKLFAECQAFSSKPGDDMTVIALRRRSHGSEAA
jgi:serine phosphatase RsbU (regulator of sigma subunit)